MKLKHLLSSRAWGGVAAFLIVLIFAADTRLPMGINIGALYVVPLLIFFLSSGMRWLLPVAIVASALLVIGGLLSPSGMFWTGIVNRILGVSVLWLAAALVIILARRSRELEVQEARGREAEAAVRQFDKDLADIKYALDQSAIVAATDRRGRITYANDKFCEISKYSREELIGEDHRIVNSGYHSKEFMRDLWRTIGAGRLWHGEIRNRAKDGSVYWVDTTIVPFLDSGGRPYQYMAIRNDITERKLAEQRLSEQEALTRLGQMAAVVAHEVKNPLAGALGALQVIGGRLPAESPDRAIMRDIVARLEALNQMVQDLLVFARPRLPQRVRVPIRLLLEDTAALLARDQGMSRLTVRIEGEDVALAADADQLKSVFLNVLLNAAQAMEGEGTVRMTLAVRDGMCEVAVQDQGPGIPPDVRERVFEPFFSTKHRGSGLGLALARRLVDMHGGTIELDCPAGGGTVLRIRLPVDEGIRQDQGGGQPREPATAARGDQA